MILVTITQSCIASEGIFFDTNTAKKLASDIKYCKEALPKTQEDLKLCNAQVRILKEKDRNSKEEITGLKEDKELLTKVSDKYKQNYIDTNKNLISCQESKPSRLTWLLSGSIATLILTVVGSIYIKR